MDQRQKSSINWHCVVSTWDKQQLEQYWTNWSASARQQGSGRGNVAAHQLPSATARGWIDGGAVGSSWPLEAEGKERMVVELRVPFPQNPPNFEHSVCKLASINGLSPPYSSCLLLHRLYPLLFYFALILLMRHSFTLSRRSGTRPILWKQQITNTKLFPTCPDIHAVAVVQRGTCRVVVVVVVSQE